MSKETRQAPQAIAHEKSSASRSVVYRIAYLLADGVQLLFIGLLIEFLLFSQIELNLAFRLIVIAVLLAGTAKGQGWLILLATQTCLFLSEPGRGLVGWEMSSLLFCGAVLALIAYACSFSSTAGRISHWFATGVVALAGRIESQQSSTAHPFGSLVTLGSTAAVLACSVLAGGLLLQFMPLTVAGRVTWLQRSLANGAVFWPGATMLTLAVVIGVLVYEARWRQMTTAQARMYLRSSFIQEQFWDLRMIVLRHLKLRKREAAAVVKKLKRGSSDA